jgi:hypothetical protein
MASDWLCPAQLSKMALRMNTKPMPGTPSRHLPLAATSASKRVVRASIGSAPNELMASTISPLPCAALTSATACSGLSTPAPVSQWIMSTCVMLASALSFASSAAADTGSWSPKSSTLQRRPIRLVSRAARLQ